MATPAKSMEALLLAEPSEGEAPVEADGGEQAAAEEALQAMREGDAAGFAAALKSFYRICASTEE